MAVVKMCADNTDALDRFVGTYITPHTPAMVDVVIAALMSNWTFPIPDMMTNWTLPTSLYP